MLSSGATMDMIYTPERVMAHFGLTVRAVRKKRQFTQENLSEKSGIGVPYISEIENGIANPTVKIICALAEALVVSPEELFRSND